MIMTAAIGRGDKRRRRSRRWPPPRPRRRRTQTENRRKAAAEAKSAKVKSELQSKSGRRGDVDQAKKRRSPTQVEKGFDQKPKQR